MAGQGWEAWQGACRILPLKMKVEHTAGTACMVLGENVNWIYNERKKITSPGLPFVSSEWLYLKLSKKSIEVGFQY